MCVCVNVSVCVLRGWSGGRVSCIVMVCWGAGWAQKGGEGPEWGYFSIHSLPNPSRCILLSLAGLPLTLFRSLAVKEMMTTVANVFIVTGTIGV